MYVLFYVAGGAPVPLFRVLQRTEGFPTVLNTVAFAVYAVMLLVGLVLFERRGNVSVRAGLLLAIALQATASVVFAAVPGIIGLIVARVIQGFATGLGTNAFATALIAAAAPPRRPLANATVSGAQPAGLGVGLLLGGAAAEALGAASTAVAFAAVAAVLVAGFVLLAARRLDEASGGGSEPSPDDRVSARRWVLAVAPLVLAAWMYAGLFLGLGPTLAGAALHIADALPAAALSALEPVAAAVASLLAGRWRTMTQIRIGAALLVAGGGLVGWAVIHGSWPWFAAAAAVGGAAFGIAFTGSLSAVQREGVRIDYTPVFVVAYLGLAVPVVAVGAVIERVGAGAIVSIYAVVLVVPAAVAPLTAARARKADNA